MPQVFTDERGELPVDVGELTLSELSGHLASTGLPNDVRGDGAVRLCGCNTLEGAGAGDVTFLANPKYRELVGTTRASAIIMKDDPSLSPRIPQLICDDPYRALTMAVIRIHGYRRHPQWGRHEHAYVAPTAKVGPNANLAPGVVICDGATIGANVTCYPGAFVGPGAVLGDDVTLYPSVTIYDECRLGDRVTVHAGSVIGEDGLGYAPVGKKWVKIPQAGNVILEDDVEIGANCTIDRATLGTTRIGSGTKFSNLVAVGHGCQVGADCMFVAQVGLAGSVTVGKHVTIAGQAGVVGHLSIGDDAQVCAQAGVNSPVKAGSVVLGAPAARSRRPAVATRPSRSSPR
ncbi:MAG: UDP-3-O-(3-hydroxymyristoyl)glucosamine N-acyltransferase [Phycisphaerales bacterium]|nr:UDP-3-O-(3-hydroxymyristoyl)glucosamine N-acyltransferase [Phycisphaerales bacterium]